MYESQVECVDCDFEDNGALCNQGRDMYTYDDQSQFETKPYPDGYKNTEGGKLDAGCYSPTHYTFYSYTCTNRSPERSWIRRSTAAVVAGQGTLRRGDAHYGGNHAREWLGGPDRLRDISQHCRRCRLPREWRERHVYADHVQVEQREPGRRSRYRTWGGWDVKS